MLYQRMFHLTITEVLGLSKASSNYPCVGCNLHRDNFATTTTNLRLRDACNGPALGRTRASIMNEAVKPIKDKSFGVKHLPLLPVPRNPNELILKIVVICELHMTIRIFGEYFVVIAAVVIVIIVYDLISITAVTDVVFL